MDRLVTMTGNSAEQQGAPPRIFRAPWSLFWVAFVVRILVILVGRTYRTPQEFDHFNFAFEIGRIAQSLVEGHGFGSPFGGNTGPTSWIMPLYPLLLAGVFKVCGTYTALSAGVMHGIDSLFDAFTAMVVAEIGGRVFGRRVGLWSGWLWALYPGTIQYPIHWIWDMSLSAMCFSLMLAQALRMRGIGDGTLRLGVRDWICFGLAWGLFGLVNPTALLLLPVSVLWLLWQPKHGISACLRNLFQQSLGVLVCALVVIAMFSPWVTRNWMAFHSFIPTRGNLGAELESAWSPLWQGFPAQGQRVGILEAEPTHQRYEKIGEVAWVREQGVRAKEWLHRDPWRVLVRDPLLRVDMFWSSVPHIDERHPWMEVGREINYAFLSVTGLLGLALAVCKKVQGAGLFLASCILMPLTYYFISAAARFRHPLEVVLIVTTVYLFSQAELRWGFSHRSPDAA